MAKLKAGRLADFSNSMAATMERALDEEWRALNGESLPAEGKNERRLLLVAVARGMLEYLKAHEDEFFTQITLTDGGVSRTSVVSDLEVNL